MDKMAELGEKKLRISKNNEIQRVKDKTKLLLIDRKNANNLVDLMAIFESQDESVIQACIRSLHKVFSTILSQKEMYLHKTLTEDLPAEGLSTEDRYKVWLRERYTECRSRLLELLTHANPRIQELSLCTLMKLVESEGQTPLRKIADKHLTFPTHFFQEIVMHLMSEEHKLEALISRFQEYLEFDDVRYFTMKQMLKVIKSREKQGCSDTYLYNVYSLLENLSMPSTSDDNLLSNFMIKLPESDSSLKICALKEHKKFFTTVWLEFLKFQLPTSVYKKVLVTLGDKVMPHMTSPLLLADFLTQSYNIGGAISLLALNGLFVLVHSFNLDYPDFFKKLYALLEPSVFHAKYKARFFFLLDLFLSSTHLPSYLVAAFAKKLSRIALTAPPSGLLIVIPFIYNLINRHPAVRVLVDRPDAPTGLECDPYLADEADPAQCNALSSSLWELQTLQHHYHHEISLESNKVDQHLPDKETDLSELLELTTDDIFKREVKKKIKTVPVTFEAPQGIFSSKDDKLKQLWTLQ